MGEVSSASPTLPKVALAAVGQYKSASVLAVEVSNVGISATGQTGEISSADVVLPSVSLAVNGYAAEQSDVLLELPPVELALAGQDGVQGDLSINCCSSTQPLLTFVGELDYTPPGGGVIGSAMPELMPVGISGIAWVPVIGDVDLDLSIVQAQVEAIQMSTCDVALAVPAVSISSEMWIPVIGDAALETPKAEIAATAQNGVNTDVALTLPVVAPAATVQVGVQFAGALTLKALSALANGTVSSSPAGTGEPELALSVNEQTGTAYDIRHADREHLITFKNASPVAVTIPAATGAFGVGWRCSVQNEGTGTVTVTPASGTINGASSQAFATNQGAWIWSAGDGKWKIAGDLT